MIFQMVGVTNNGVLFLFRVAEINDDCRNKFVVAEISEKQMYSCMVMMMMFVSK